MTKVLHTSDIHLKEYGDERWDALQCLLELGDQENINLLVISGDLFDNSSAAEKLRTELRQAFSDIDFDIVIAPGNHDQYCYEGGKFFGERVIVLTELDQPVYYPVHYPVHNSRATQETEIQDNIILWALPYEQLPRKEVYRRLKQLSDQAEKEQNQVPTYNLLLYHGDLLDLSVRTEDFGDEINGTKDGEYMPARLSYFRNLNFQYVLAGHYHSHFYVQPTFPGGYFIYPGSPVSITKKEIGRRAVNLFEVGEEPKKIYLDTFHRQKASVALDPISDTDFDGIFQKIVTPITSQYPKAELTLVIEGFINQSFLGLDEQKLYQKIQKSIKSIKKTRFSTTEETEDTGKTTDTDNTAGDYRGLPENIKLDYQIKDISEIIEDDLFQKFINKLDQDDLINQLESVSNTAKLNVGDMTSAERKAAIRNLVLSILSQSK